MKTDLILNETDIKTRIYTIRGLQVMIDRDLAELYGVETRTLNQAVKRNIERFPNDFMFQLTEDEMKNWKSQIVMTNKEKMGLRRNSYVFTEQGVANLSSVLKSDKAIEINIQIMRAFVSMRRFISSNAQIFQRLDTVETKLADHDRKIELVFKAIEDKDLKPEKGIFFDGQVFDAYKFVSDLIRSSKNSIILIDNYVDDSVLTLFNKRNKDVSVTIYTKEMTKQLSLDLEKYNSQYQNIMINEFGHSHDRFLIIDDKEVYHFGASLKDLGKKWFAFSKFDKDSFKILDRIKDY